MKERTFHEYDIPREAWTDYVIDRLIPLSLGGGSDISNLWPQPRVTKPWNPRRKDEIEARLYRSVCGGYLPLSKAREEIAANWVRAYGKYIGAPEDALRMAEWPSREGTD